MLIVVKFAWSYWPYIYDFVLSAALCSLGVGSFMFPLCTLISCSEGSNPVTSSPQANVDKVPLSVSSFTSQFNPEVVQHEIRKVKGKNQNGFVAFFKRTLFR